MIGALLLIALLIVRKIMEEAVLIHDLASYEVRMGRVRWRLVPWNW